MPTDCLLQVRNLRFAYPGGEPLFGGWDFDLAPGLTQLDGERGKTTLLRVLAGELPATGRFMLHGAPWSPGSAPGASLVDPRSATWEPMTADALADAVRARHPAFDGAAWQRHLAAFDLLPHAGKTMHMLSTGSRRKVALAAMLASNATLTLLDEPTAGLDRPALDHLAGALAEAAAGGTRALLLASAWGLEDRLPGCARLVLPA